jgi:PAS domain S-box-containing protein
MGEGRRAGGVRTGVYHAALLATAYLAIADTARRISPGDDVYGFFWLPAGLLVAMLLLTTRARWPALLAGAMVGDAAFELLHHLPPATIGTRFFVTALQAVAGAVAVERVFGRPLRLATARGLLWFLFFAVMLATLGGAMLAVALTEGFASAAAYGQALWPRWGSNAMGVLLLAPLMLAWSAPVETSLGRARAMRRLEAAALLAATLASVVAVFVFASGISSPLRILLPVPALWAGLRFGLRGATVVHFALAAPIAFFTGAALQGLPIAQQLELHVGPAQILVSLITVAGLALAVVIQESQAQFEALRRSEELFRVAMQFSPIGAAIVGLDGRWIDVNPALCRILGYGREDLLPRDFQSITHPEDLDADLEQMQRTLAGEIDGYRIEKRYIRRDGAVIRAQLDGVLLRTAEGAPLHFLANVQDITNRKEAQRRILELNTTLESRVVERTRELETANRELELANRELESFTSSVSHDLRSPLRLIEGFSQMLARECQGRDDAGVLGDIDRIRAAAHRMDELIDSMLRMARQTRGPLQRQAVDLSAIARETMDLLSAASPERRVRVTIQPGLVAQGSEALLRAVVENLLGNAWKFTAKVPEAEIEVGQEERGGEAMFYVRDNGAGFNMVHSDQLFRAFRRLHDESEYPGTGIGLVTVQRIVQRHGGRVDFDSEVDEGACFWFSVPDRSRAA